jgi:2-polyprenyl-3-methyl-5-hydroxy-6-metoxy-1,4-benzoquinol methylase
MALSLLKHRIKSALGRPSVPPPVKGVAGADWYDKAYAILPKYADPYWQSHYYPVWTPIVDRVRRDKLQRVVDIGCGPGQFARMLFDMGNVSEYTGLDFSPTAVSMAQGACPNGKFVVGDATTTRLCLDTPHDVVICMEVLEHVPADESVIERFQPGVRAICTVPNFDYDSHVRFFKTAEEVADRYGRFFDRFDVFPILGHYNPKHTYYVMDGIRRS